MNELKTALLGKKANIETLVITEGNRAQVASRIRRCPV
jgi:hypothetical protein